MVGSALACLLATSPATRHLRVAVLEPAPPKASAIASLTAAAAAGAAGAAPSDAKLPVPSLRTVALSHQSIDLLKRSGVWDSVVQTRCVGVFLHFVPSPRMLCLPSYIQRAYPKQNCFIFLLAFFILFVPAGALRRTTG